jgi:uncharacterized protein (TIGR00369 family)
MADRKKKLVKSHPLLCWDIASQALYLKANTKDMPTVMNIDERIKNSTTQIFKAVFPNTTNHYDTLFGGIAMQLMDEAAFITATRFTRKRVVTVSSNKIDFKKPIPAGTIVELIGKVIHVGNTSLKVLVAIYVEEMYSERRERAVTGDFTFVAIDEEKNQYGYYDNATQV